jgi:hypothetical protein
MEILKTSQGNPFDGATADDIKIVEPSESSAQGYEGDSGASGYENTDDESGGNTEMVETPGAPAQENQSAPAITTEQQSAVAAPNPDLDITQVVSKYDQKALLQALGYDDYAINALNYYKEVGNLDDYLAVKSIDFTKMTPEQIMRYDYAKKYKGLPEDALNFKVEKDLRDKYGISSDLDEDQLRAPMALFSYEMDAVRKDLIDEQAKFAPPPRQAQPQADPQALRNEVLADKFVQSLMQNKAITIGADPKESVNLSVNPDKILPIIYDGEAYDAAVSVKDKNGNSTGQKDMALLTELAVFLADPVAYKKTLIDHGKTLGKKAIRNTLTNPSEENVVGTPPRQENDLFDALARRGIHRG